MTNYAVQQFLYNSRSSDSLLDHVNESIFSEIVANMLARLALSNIYDDFYSRMV